jgi:ABC-type Mn2+/Zn2+ transport system ATPase subunit
MTSSAVSVQDVTGGYHGDPVIHDVSWEVPHGSLAAIIGPNGGGKSTLLKSLVGLVKPWHGRVFLFGQEPEQGRKRVAYLPQAEEVDWQFPISVWDVVLQGRWLRKGLWGRLTREDLDKAESALTHFDINHLAKTQIGSLSGGQRQRVFLARAVAQEADLILLDEPNTGLDARAQHELADTLTRLKEEGRTIIVATHDLDCLTECFDQVLALKSTVVAHGSPRDVLTAEILTALFARHFPSLRETGEVVIHEP